jgi:hypothetical protein
MPVDDIHKSTGGKLPPARGKRQSFLHRIPPEKTANPGTKRAVIHESTAPTTNTTDSSLYNIERYKQRAGGTIHREGLERHPSGGTKNHGNGQAKGVEKVLVSPGWDML